VQAVNGSQAVWTPQRFDRLIQEGYEHAVWVYACVQEQVRVIRLTRWLLFNGDNEVETHPLLDLLNRPNEEQAGAAFLEAAMGFWLTSGNTYVERVGVENRPPAELWVKRPDRMRVIPDLDNRIRGYEYEVGGRRHTFERWQIKHLKTWAPLDDWYGLSPIQAAARGVDVFNAGQAHNLALIQNGARPSGAWVSEGRLSDAEFERFKAEVRDAVTTRHRGTPIILEGGVTWQELGINPKDLDFLAGQQDAARQIHAAYGVHPVLTGLQVGTFENQRQAQRALAINIILPFLDMLVGEFNEWLAPAYPGRLRLAYDRDAFPALNEDEDSLWNRSSTGWRSGILTRNEARVMLGFDEVDDERGNLFTDELLGRRLAAPATLPDAPAPAEERRRKVRDIDDDYYAAQRIGLQLAWEENLNRWIAARFNEEREALAGRAAQATDAAALTAAAEESTRDTFATLLTQWLAIAADGADHALIEHDLKALPGAPAGKQLPSGSPLALFLELFGIYFQQTVDFAIAHVAALRGEIAATTLRRVSEVVAAGTRTGLSIPEIAEELDTLYLDEIIPNRSTVIARTETIRATNFGGQQAAKATGLNLTKTWLATVTDDRTRDAHRHANGQTVPIDHPYLVGDEELMYPGDPAGSASNTIQCRCSERYSEAT